MREILLTWASWELKLIRRKVKKEGLEEEEREGKVGDERFHWGMSLKINNEKIEWEFYL